jgi:hypothetical protein
MVRFSENGLNLAIAVEFPSKWPESNNSIWNPVKVAKILLASDGISSPVIFSPLIIFSYNPNTEKYF